MSLDGDIDDLVDALRSSLAFDDAPPSSCVNIPAPSTSSPTWSATQQQRERCGWTPRAITRDAHDIDAIDNITRERLKAMLARLLMLRASLQSTSHLRLWWLTIVKITVRLDEEPIDENERKDVAAEDMGFRDVCQVLVDDIASLARMEPAPEREWWGAKVAEALVAPVDVASRWETLVRATAGLFNHAPRILIETFVSGLKSRLGQSARGEAYWLLFVLSVVAPNGDGAVDVTGQLLLALNPMSWTPTFRKSDFRQCLSITLEAILYQYLANNRLNVASVDVSILNAVLSDVIKWMSENEKKQANAGLPLRMILNTMVLVVDGGASLAKVWPVVEARILSGMENKMKMSSLIATIRNTFLGVSPSIDSIKLSQVLENGLKSCINSIERGASMIDDIGAMKLAQAAVALHAVDNGRGVDLLNELLTSRVLLMNLVGMTACEDIIHHLALSTSEASERFNRLVDETLPKLFNTALERTLPSFAKAALLRCTRLVSAEDLPEKFVTQLMCHATVDESIISRLAAEESLLYVYEVRADLRDSCLQELASTILNFRTLEPSARLSAMNTLTSMCQLWVKLIDGDQIQDVKSNFERAESAALLLICDADSSVRISAMKALETISVLQSNVTPGSTSVYSVLEEYLTLIDDVPSFIRKFSADMARSCPMVCTTAHAQAYQRIQAMMVAEGDGKIPMTPVEPSEYKFNLWQNYMLFVCAVDITDVSVNEGKRQVVTIGQRGSLSDLLKMVIPRLGRSESEAEAVMRLFLIVPDKSKSVILNALVPLQGSLMASTLVKRKFRDDVSMMLRFGYVYQNYGVNGVFMKNIDSTTFDAIVDFVLMVCSYLKATAQNECSEDEISQLKFSASNIIATVLIDAKQVQRLPGVTQGELWDSFLAWQEVLSLGASSQNQTDPTSRERTRQLIQNKEAIPSANDVCWAAREALASLSLSEQFILGASKKVFAWVNKLSEYTTDASRELSLRVLTRVLKANSNELFSSSLDFCYSPSMHVARMHLTVIATLHTEAMQFIGCERLIALVLYKILHEDADIRSAANALLRVIQDHARVKDATNETVTNESQLIAICEQIMKTETQPIEGILLEVWKRQLEDAVSVLKTHSHVLAALVPWVSVLHLPHLVATGKAEQILNGLYQVAMVSKDDRRSQADRLWSAIGAQPRNIAPALRFLQDRAFEIATTSRSTSAFQTAKVACRMLSQSSSQQAIDQLVYTISFRALELDENESKGSDVASSKISLADVGIILLSELATDHSEGFRFHLPVLAHAVVVTLIVTNEPIVRQYCGHLLCNLASKSSDESRAKSSASRLTRLFQNDGTQPWMASKIRQLVNVLPRAIDLDENLSSRWASEAQRWLLRSPSLMLSRASAMTLMALNHPLEDEAFDALLSATCACAMLSEQNESKTQAAEELTQALLKVITSSICEMNGQDVLMYTQAFWCGVSCLRTFEENVYSCAIDLCFMFLYKCSLDGPTMALEVIKSCAPLPRGAQYPDLPIVESYEELLSITPEPMPSAEITFSQVVPLVIKGLLKLPTCVRSIRVLAILAPHVKGEVWRDVDVIVLIVCALLPVILTSVDGSSGMNNSIINSNEARAIAHKLAQGLMLSRMFPRLSEALMKFAAEKSRTKSCLDALDSAFIATVQDLNAPLVIQLLREFASCTDAPTAKKILQILASAPKAPKTFKREFLSLWSTDSSARTMSDAMYGVLLSARLDTDKNSIPACLDT